MTTSNKVDRETTQKRAEDILADIGRFHAHQVLEEYKKSEADIAMTQVPEELRAKVIRAVRTAGEESVRTPRHPVSILATVKR